MEGGRPESDLQEALFFFFVLLGPLGGLLEGGSRSRGAHLAALEASLGRSVLVLGPPYGALGGSSALWVAFSPDAGRDFLGSLP